MIKLSKHKIKLLRDKFPLGTESRFVKIVMALNDIYPSMSLKEAKDWADLICDRQDRLISEEDRVSNGIKHLQAYRQKLRHIIRCNQPPPSGVNKEKSNA